MAAPGIRAVAAAAGAVRVVDDWDLSGWCLYVSERELRALEALGVLRRDEPVAVRHAERKECCCVVAIRPLVVSASAVSSHEAAAAAGGSSLNARPPPYTLYCSKEFSVSSQLTQGDAVVLSPCQPHLLDLSYVVFACHGDEAFAAAKRYLAVVRQLLRDPKQQPLEVAAPDAAQPGAARQSPSVVSAVAQRGATLLAGLCVCASAAMEPDALPGTAVARDVVIGETKPFRRGRLTPKTGVYVIKLAAEADGQQAWRRRKALAAMRKSGTFSSLPECMSRYSDACDNNGAQPLAVEQRLEAVASPTDFDPLYVVALSPVAMSRLSLTDGEHVHVTAASATGKARPAERGGRTMVAKVDSRLAEGNVAITQPAWFNLTRGKAADPVAFVKRLVPPGLTATGSSSSGSGGRPTGSSGRPASSCCDGSEIVLRFAESVSVAVVRCPSYSHSDVENAAPSLRAYFSHRRCVKQGDVLVVVSKDNQMRIMYKVMTIRPTPGDDEVLMADNDHTSVVREDYVRSLVPPFGASLPAAPLVDGLGGYANQLAKLARPYLQQQRSRSGGNIRPPVFLLSGLPGCGKVTILRHVAAKLCINYHQINCYDLVGDTPSSTEARLRDAIGKVMASVPCLLVLRNIDAVHRDRENMQENPRTASVMRELLDGSWPATAEWPLITVATCSGSRRLLADDVREAFLHEITVEPPTEAERHDMLCSLLPGDSCDGSVAIAQLAEHTAGFLLGDIIALVAAAQRHSHYRSMALCKQQLGYESLEAVEIAGCFITAADLDLALLEVQAAHASAMGRPKIPSVKWEDIGGLSDVKEAILDTVQLPLQHPELLAQGLRRSGLLLYGPPGTGKTLLAKAVASECSLNFLSVKGPELINKYVGQSEENVRDLFARARQSAPAVIFFDELDSLAPRRGHSGDSGGVMDRVVSQLLAELDGLHRSADVFVIGATNRPDLLDGALLRPGRFDKLLYVGISGSKQEQLRVLKALTRRFTLAADCRLEDVVEHCPPNLTGADLYAACAGAMTAAIKRQIDALETGQHRSAEAPRVTVSTADFLSTLSTLVPSVSAEELHRYEVLRNALTAR